MEPNEANKPFPYKLENLTEDALLRLVVDGKAAPTNDAAPWPEIRARGEAAQRELDRRAQASGPRRS